MTAATPVRLCECTHRFARHNDGGECLDTRCECTVYREIVPGEAPRPAPLPEPTAKPAKRHLAAVPASAKKGGGTISSIIADAQGSGVPRLVAAAEKIIVAAYELEARMNQEIVKESARRQAVQARVTKLEAQLADARRELVQGKQATPPKRTRKPAPEEKTVPCRHCPDMFRTPAGRGSHEFRKHNIRAAG